MRARAGRYVATRIPLTRACPRALSLVWSAGTSICGATSSSPSQSWSSTDSRTLSKERGRETSHTRQHASLSSLHAAGGTYLRLVRAAMLPRASPTDVRAPAPSLLCGPQVAQSVRQPARRPPRVRLQQTHEPSVRSGGERHVTHASTRLCHAHPTDALAPAPSRSIVLLLFLQKQNLATAAGGTYLRLVRAAMMPRASPH